VKPDCGYGLDIGHESHKIELFISHFPKSWN